MCSSDLTRLLARHARDHGPAAGHKCLAKLVQGTVCKILSHEEIKPHKVRYIRHAPDLAPALPSCPLVTDSVEKVFLG